LNYFGNSNYGIWILVLGLAGYINAISFGIPSAMVALVAKSSSMNEKYKILKKSFHILLLLSVFFLAVFVLVLYFNDDWIISLLGNVDTELVSITKKLFILFVIFTLVKLPFNLYMQFFTGMNLIYITEIYRTLAALMNFVSVLIAVLFNIEIVNFAILWLSGQLLLDIIAVFHVLMKYAYLKNGSDNISDITNSVILKSGFAFFQVGIAAGIVWSTDNLVISHFLSIDDVTPYSIAFKIFTYTFLISATLNGVIAPIYGNAYAIEDWAKIKKYTNFILKVLTFFGAIVWVSLLFFSKEVIDLWTHNDGAFGGYFLIFSLGLYGYILSFVNTFATVVYALNWANLVLKIVWAEALVNLFLSIILVQFSGIGGVALATAFAAFLTAFLYLPRVIKNQSNHRVTYDYSYVKKQFFYLVLPMVIISIESIDIEDILLKILLYCLLMFLFCWFSWKLLNNDDQQTLRSFLKVKPVQVRI